MNTGSIAKLKEKHGVELKYTLFPLHPYIPDEGMSIEDLFRGRDIDIEAVKKQMRELMEREGLEYSDRTMTYNSRPAQELAKWAETQKCGQSIHDVLYRAYFVDNTNLADAGELVAIAGSLDLDRGKATEVVENRLYSDEVDADWKRCRELGIMAIPSYLCSDRKRVGAQSYPSLEKLILAEDDPAGSSDILL